MALLIVFGPAYHSGLYGSASEIRSNAHDDPYGVGRGWGVERGLGAGVGLGVGLGLALKVPYSTSDNHFTASPHCRMKVSAIRCVRGARSRLAVGVGIVYPSGVGEPESLNR